MSLWLLMFQLTEFYCNNFPAIDILMYMYNCYFDEDVSSFAFIPIEEQDKHCLQELAAEQRCIVEHILCTKPLPFRYCCFLFLTTKNVDKTWMGLCYFCIVLSYLSWVLPTVEISLAALCLSALCHTKTKNITVSFRHWSNNYALWNIK